MVKQMLAVFLSLLIIGFTQSMAWAKDGPVRHSSAKKPAAKKTAIAKKPVIHSRVKARRTAPSMRERMVRRVVMVHGKRRVVHQPVLARTIRVAPAVLTAGDLAGLSATHDPLDLKSNVALVMDQNNSQVLFEKNANIALPIASITKLMTSIVVVEAKQDMDEMLTITEEDVDREKFSTSRLRVGAQLTRANMLHIALMSSENRAASALGRNYPGGLKAFVAAMNAKAKALGMSESHYVDSHGLSSRNIASARDLAKLVIAAHQYPLIREYSTDSKYIVDTGGHELHYANTNHLVVNPDWDIGLQKTGYISEAGRCLVMQAKIEGRSVVMVFLDSKGKQSRLGDASRIRKWLEGISPRAM